MTLSCGSCLMTSCATVSPPIPESKTPTGAVVDFDVTTATSPCQRGTDGRAPARTDANSESRRNVPEVRGDEGISPGEQVIRDHDGNPVFNVGVACPNLPRRERRRRGRFL